jgi:hypothetical protein
MRNARVWGVLVVCLFAAAIIGFAKTRQAGLWEISTTTTWQKSPVAPGSAAGLPSGGTRTRQVCLTQEMIDQYGALLPQSHGQCRVENKAAKPGGATALWVCNGKMKGQGAMETSWSDLQHASGTVHFQGTFEVESRPLPVEWTTETNYSFKNADCGAVKPEAISPGPQ